MTDEEIRNLWRTHDDVIDFARTIEQLVREECAVICESHGGFPAYEVAEAIRGRGKDE